MDSIQRTARSTGRVVMERVVITKAMMNPADWGIMALVYMQVCAVADAADEEILAVCNTQNPSGTSNGWARVVRSGEENLLPAVCGQDAGRMHFLVTC